MPLTPEDRKLFDRLNKRWKNFRTQNVINNTWGLAINELQNIYAESDMHGINTDRWGGLNQNVFTLSKNLDEETIEAMRKVARFLDDTKSSSIGYYKRNKDVDERAYQAYMTILNRPDNHVVDLQSYIDMIDDMETSKDIKGLRDALTSDNIMRTYDYARSLNLTNAEVDKIIINGLKKTLTGDPLYNWLRGEIKAAYDAKHYKS